MKRKFFVILTLLVILTLTLTACSEPEITALTVVEGTLDLEYEVGETPDFSGVKVVVTYENGEAETVVADKLTFGSLDTSTAGEKELSISYKDFTVKVTVTVTDAQPPAPTLENIEIIGSTLPSTVLLNGTVSLDALNVKANYSDDTFKVLTLTDVTVASIDTSAVGDATVTVTYEGKTATAKVKVLGVKEMSVLSGTYDEIIEKGTTLATNSVKVFVTYTDDSTATVTADRLTFGSIDNNTLGNQQLSVTYLDKTVKVNVYVNAAVELILNDSTVADKIIFGGSLDTSNIKAEVIYHNEDTELLDASDLEISFPGTSEAGDKTLTVTYKGCSDSKTIKVVGVSALNVSAPNEIIKGGTYDKTLITATATLTDGTTKTLSNQDLTIEGDIVTSELGNKSITVKYLDASKNVSVKVYGLFGIEVDASSVNTTVIQGLTPDISGMKVYKIYDNAAKTKEEITGFTTNISSLNFNDNENDTLTVTYVDPIFGEKTTTVIFSTTAPTLESISLSVAQGAGRIFKGTAYDKANLTVTAYYNNNTSKTVAAADFSVALDTATIGSKTLTVTYEGKTATAEITVYKISRVVLTTGNNFINKGESFDLSSLGVVVKYTDGEEKILAATEYTVNGAIDGNTAGDQTVSVTHNGVESNTITVHVKGITTVELKKVPTYVLIGFVLDKSNMYLRVNYTNGTYDNIRLSDSAITVISDVDTSVQNLTGASFKVSYKGYEAEQLIKVSGIDVVIIDSNSIPKEVMVGENYNYNGLKVTIVYDDGDGNPLTGTMVQVDLNDPNLTIVVPDTSSKGDKAFKVTYMGKEKSIAIHVKGVESASVVPGTVATTVKKDSIFSTAELKLLVEYSNEMIEIIDASRLQITGISTATAGTKELKIKYLDKEIVVAIEVIEVAQGTQDGFIYGVSLPDNLVGRDTYKESYKIKNEGYVVGDDNPYYFYLDLLQLDKNYNIVDVDGKNFASVIKVELIDGKNETLLEGDALTQYVAVDSAKNSYDFTEAAIGKTFKLTIYPDGNVVDIKSCTRSHTVTVVDGYNIYEAWELNYITNSSDDIDGDNNNINPGDKYQRDAVIDYLKTEHEVSDPAKIIDSISGIVIHGNLSVKPSDLPEEYFEQREDNESYGLFYDFVYVYNRNIKSGQTFRMHGNYYTIYTYELPCIVKNGHVTRQDDIASHSKMFRFHGLTDAEYKALSGKNTEFNHKNYKAVVSNLSLRDNDPNSNDQNASERHIRGMGALNPLWCDITVYNTNIHAYYISMVPENDDLTVNIISSDFYNAWQGHLFIWNNNSAYTHDLGVYSNGSYTHNNYQPVKINIIDSRLAKCGGPVILSQTDINEDRNKNISGADVVAIDSELYSYVTGQEAWFVAMNQTALAGQILALDQPLSGTAAYMKTPASYITDKKITGVNTMNMIMVNMGVGMDMSGSGYKGTFTSVKTENGEEISRVVGLSMDPNTTDMVDSYIAAIKAATGKDAPVFQSSAGGTCYTDMKTGVYGIEQGAGSPPQSSCFQGDYITLYFMGLGVMFEYYH